MAGLLHDHRGGYIRRDWAKMQTVHWQLGRVAKLELREGARRSDLANASATGTRRLYNCDKRQAHDPSVSEGSLRLRGS
jgi:hypothetical protein